LWQAGEVLAQEEAKARHPLEETTRMGFPAHQRIPQRPGVGSPQGRQHVLGGTHAPPSRPPIRGGRSAPVPSSRVPPRQSEAPVPPHGFPTAYGARSSDKLPHPRSVWAMKPQSWTTVGQSAATKSCACARLFRNCS
jgi:hypothetical protein